MSITLVAPEQRTLPIVKIKADLWAETINLVVRTPGGPNTGWAPFDVAQAQAFIDDMQAKVNSITMWTDSALTDLDRADEDTLARIYQAVR